MALLSFEFDFFVKSCRHFIGILAWTWAIFVFCLSYIGRSNSYNNNDHYFLNNQRHGHGAPSLYRTVFLPILKVLLVAPSASLAGPVPSPSPTVASTGGGDASPSPPSGQSAANQNLAHPVVIPWGQGIAINGGGVQGQPGALPLGGFIYCAGCSPINPGQLVLPSNVPWNKALTASGVIPPEVAKVVQKEGGYTLEQQLNGLGEASGAEESGKNIWSDGGIPVQQMALHDDGRYSFSYNTAHASRQEERNLEGNVQGSYSYTDPEGKVVQIDYTAGPQGYQAYGENVPPQPVLQLPQPVQDTLEVQIARQQFLETYNRELERIQRDQEIAAARAATSTVAPEGVYSTTPSSSEVTDESSARAPSDDNEGSETENDDAIVVSGKTDSDAQSSDLQPVPVPPAPVVEGGAEGVVDEQAESIVITAKGEQQDDEPQVPIDVRNNLPDPSYQITIPIGVEGNQRVSVQGGARGQDEGQEVNNQIGQGSQQGQAQAVPVNMMNLDGFGPKSNLQPYFYYVSVGGQPHYVTSNPQPGYNSPYPTSLKATLLGAQPLAAVHDAQVSKSQQSNANSAQQSPMIRPIFLDLENGLKLESTQGHQQQSSQQPQLQLINPASLFMLNAQNQGQQQNLGQLIPLGLSQGNTATFGYIPALILNNGNGNNGQQQAQNAQGSQQLNNNVPLQQYQQQQQQVSGLPTLNNQPIIVLASKK